MVASEPSGPIMVAKVQKNIENISAVAMPRYRVWILCHIVLCFYRRMAKVGIFIGKNYIWKTLW